MVYQYKCIIMIWYYFNVDNDTTVLNLNFKQIWLYFCNNFPFIIIQRFNVMLYELY